MYFSSFFSFGSPKIVTKESQNGKRKKYFLTVGSSKMSTPCELKNRNVAQQYLDQTRDEKLSPATILNRHLLNKNQSLIII